jgi:hypothetical protein
MPGRPPRDRSRATKPRLLAEWPVQRSKARLRSTCRSAAALRCAVARRSKHWSVVQPVASRSSRAPTRWWSSQAQPLWALPARYAPRSGGAGSTHQCSRSSRRTRRPAHTTASSRPASPPRSTDMMGGGGLRLWQPSTAEASPESPYAQRASTMTPSTTNRLMRFASMLSSQSSGMSRYIVRIFQRPSRS